MPYKTLVLFLLLNIAFSTMKAQDSTNTPIVGFDYVEQLLQPKNDDTTYIINFWATWCRPCVKELPFITNLETKYADKKIKVFLVSLDFKKNYDKMLAFLKKRNITTSAVLLSAPDANALIDRVDKSWGGAIPATLIFNNTKRAFFEQEFHEQDLYKTVESFF